MIDWERVEKYIQKNKLSEDVANEFRATLHKKELLKLKV